MLLFAGQHVFLHYLHPSLLISAYFLSSCPAYVDGSVNVFRVWFEPGASTGWIYTGTK